MRVCRSTLPRAVTLRCHGSCVVVDYLGPPLGGSASTTHQAARRFESDSKYSIQTLRRRSIPERSNEVEVLQESLDAPARPYCFGHLASLFNTTAYTDHRVHQSDIRQHGGEVKGRSGEPRQQSKHARASGPWSCGPRLEPPPELSSWPSSSFPSGCCERNT